MADWTVLFLPLALVCSSLPILLWVASLLHSYISRVGWGTGGLLFRGFGYFLSEFALNFMFFLFMFLPLKHDTAVWFSPTMLKILKFYFLLILITCALSYSEWGRHWHCWNYTLAHRVKQQCLWEDGGAVCRWCWDFNPINCASSYPAPFLLAVWYAEACGVLKCFSSCAMSDQPKRGWCSPAVGKSLGESNDHDLERVFSVSSRAYVDTL